MKILYGVQATGNGHITRARSMSKHLAANGIEVDYLLSGREKDKFFDMEPFGDWQWRKGLTFIHKAGSMDTLATIKQNSIVHLVKDIKELDVSGYDAVLTDFEPIAAWAAKRSDKACIGLGHQYAFHHKVPQKGGSFISSKIMKHFAPVDVSLGLHWHHFNQPILPPIAEVHPSESACDPNKIVVYLGFEDPEQVIAMLEPFEDHLFVFYGPFPEYQSRGHIQLKPLSREGFKHDLATAAGVICNAGFELSSESIQLGKKLLIKPMLGQMEQVSNAVALEELGLGKTMNSLDQSKVREWLESWEGKQVVYPDIAKAISQWVAKGDWHNPQSRSELIQEVWQEVKAPGIASFESSPVPPLGFSPV